MGFCTRKKRHFRGHKTRVKGKVVTHPSYIVGEEGRRYLSFGLTHSPKKGKGHPNLPLFQNPNSSDASKAYLRKQLESDYKSNYTKHQYSDYSMSEKDDDSVDYLIAKRRK